MGSGQSAGNARHTTTSVVTGAFGLSGQEIAKSLLARGERVRTLTNHPQPGSPIFPQVEVYPLDFNNFGELTASLIGASVLYNTYWIRFPYHGVTHQQAVQNTELLVGAAEAAGVKRIVHISVTNASPDLPLPYFKGKAEVERVITSSSLSYAILRPALIFGDDDILINNIAYLLKRLPVFFIPGRGEYRVQPIFIKDLAELAVEGGSRSDSYVADAVGPETYSYTELVQMIRTAVGSKSSVVHVPPAALRLASAALGRFLKDVVLTDDEIKGLMADLLVSRDAPTGRTSFQEWISCHAAAVGKSYASELRRHYAAGVVG